jgi:hypothetical protein
MTRPLKVLALFLLANCGTIDDTAQAAMPLAKCAPTPPDPSLAVPDGNKLVLATNAKGVQVYACQNTAAGPAWTFVFPEAVLTRDDRAVAFHFAGPTWEALDTSTVVGTKVAGVTVDATAIPWLLLSGSAHTGDGKFSNVTFIQRFNTVGGLAPTTGCDAAHLGAVSRVDYVADYFFYEAGKSPSCKN